MKAVVVLFEVIHPVMDVPCYVMRHWEGEFFVISVEKILSKGEIV